MRSTQDRIAEALDGGIPVTETTPNAPTGTDAEVLAANPNRRLLVVENRGSNEVHLSFGAEASTATLTLAVGQQEFFRQPAPTNALRAIAATGATALYIMEG